MSETDGHPDGLRRRAIETASDVFDRLIEELDRPQMASPRIDAALEGFDDSGADAGRPGLWEMRRTFGRAIDLYADLARMTFEAYADVVEASVGRGTAAAPADAGAEAPVLLTGRPGAQAEAAVWIHNPSRAAFSGLALRMTDLIAHDGARIEASLGSFLPSELDVAPSTSASAILSVRIPESAAASVYYGHVLAVGAPDAGAPTRLVVE